jgi:FkbM family methyltransferase
MKYSQNNEEYHILKRFPRGYKGRFLDIGAYDGKRLSNTYALMIRGWEGDLIEPSEEVYPKLLENVKGFKVRIGKFAIANHDGELTFYDNGNAVATASKKDKSKWVKESFKEITVKCRRFDSIWNEKDKFDFISIDVEGLDVDVLKQIDIDKHEVKCICVEWNSIPKNFKEIDKYLKGFNMKLVHKNAENLIYVK